jgi:hypothetical protein
VFTLPGLRHLLPFIALASLLAGPVGCTSADVVYEHAPSAALEKQLTAASLAVPRDHQVDGVWVVPSVRTFSADFSRSVAGLRFYAASPAKIWVSRATLSTSTGLSTTMELNQWVEVKKPVAGKPGVLWGGAGLFTEDNLDFPAMRAAEGLTLRVWAGGTESAPASDALVFPITHRVERGIVWPT